MYRCTDLISFIDSTWLTILEIYQKFTRFAILFLTDLQKNVQIVWIGKYYICLPKWQSTSDFFLCENTQHNCYADTNWY